MCSTPKPKEDPSQPKELFPQVLVQAQSGNCGRRDRSDANDRDRRSSHSRDRDRSDSGGSSNNSNIAGVIREVKIIDQWSPAFKSIIKQYNAPSAICGYVAPAIAALAHTFPCTMTEAQVLSMQRFLSTPRAVLPLVTELMDYVCRDRADYISRYPQEFGGGGGCAGKAGTSSPTAAKKTNNGSSSSSNGSGGVNPALKDHYMSNWVANYEISDFIR